MFSFQQDQWRDGVNTLAYDCFSNRNKEITTYAGYLRSCSLLNNQPSINIMKGTPISLRKEVKFLTAVYRIWFHFLRWPFLAYLNSCKPAITPSAISTPPCCSDAGQTCSHWTPAFPGPETFILHLSLLPAPSLLFGFGLHSTPVRSTRIHSN